MTPFFIASGAHTIAAFYEEPAAAATRTAVLLVPPFGWDEQTSYRPRREWSRTLAESGFANLRIDLPGTADSSGTPRDPALLDAWTQAVASAVAWLRALNPDRIAVIALGAGGLVTLRAIAQGTRVDDLILWGVPANGRALLREFKAFGRLEQSQTGEPPGGTPPGELRAGGHVLAPATAAALSGLDGAMLAAAAQPARALLLGRDGTGPEMSLVEALRGNGAKVATDAGRGWGAALARPQSIAPMSIFALVNSWLAQAASPGALRMPRQLPGDAELGVPGARIRETPILFEGGGQQLYAVLAEPVDAPVADGTAVLFNAGAIRRIGPNRMWTEAARRWAASGVPVLRVDVEGIGDADGDASPYRDSDDHFYTQALIDQARSALDVAAARGLPQRFFLAGLCSGGFWGFQAALADARVKGVVALNPRMLIFDPGVEAHRDVQRLRRIMTTGGIRRMLVQEHKLKRLAKLLLVVFGAPLRALRGDKQDIDDRLFEGLRLMRSRGQRMDIAFCAGEPLDAELRAGGGRAALEKLGVGFHDLPYMSHTLKPLAAQEAAHAMLDTIVEQSIRAGTRPRAGKRPRRTPARAL